MKNPLIALFWHLSVYFCSLSSAKSALCCLGKKVSHTWTPTMDELSATQTLLLSQWHIKLDLESNKITDFIKFDVGNVVMVTGGRNRGRVGSSRTGRSKKGASRLSIFRMPLGMSLQLDWAMCSTLAREQNHGFLFLRVRVLSFPFLKKPGRGLELKHHPESNKKIWCKLSSKV